MKHIGMDVHSTTTDICVRNEKGIIVQRCRITTQASELEKFILSLKGQKRIVLEEDQMADWVTRVLEPHAEEVIRCLPRYNKLITGSEDKCDKIDAESLSELLYINRIKRVHHPAETYRTLREAVRAYWIASRELTRAKNRLKGWYLFNGVHKQGQTIYTLRNRAKHLDELQKQGRNTELAELLYERMDVCRQLKTKHIRLLRKVAHPVEDLVQLLTTIPAIGKISAYSLVSLLEDGWRIPNKRKLWRYAGLSLRRYESRDKGFKGASKTGNRILKHVVMSAAITVMAQGKRNGLLSLWERDIQNFVNPKRARRNLARKIVVIAQCLLRTKQEYQDDLTWIAKLTCKSE
jgi:transposase